MLYIDTLCDSKNYELLCDLIYIIPAEKITVLYDYKELVIKNIRIKNNIANSRFNSTRLEYKNMIRSYYDKKDFDKNKKIFKKEYLKFMNKYVLKNPNI